MTSPSTTTKSSSSATLGPQVTLMRTSNNNINQPPSLIAINSAQVPIKLTKGENYAAWRSQFENLFFGYGLMGYLDSTKPCPPKFVLATTANVVDQESEQTTANPDYQLWLCQDRLLLHAI
ncbi:hypothetical protein Ddye_025278 [Dipteronia dyeriana]|uniref:Retrotransposon Copia-like N-terminal domain-containing protein n=1 Tax=Dipteronia dyeriana TaxID=168575 RepID=A0AAD9WV84_9ROSI|nr:hypothetical protein Ddye_025278 [Dipteronia dyeriana]